MSSNAQCVRCAQTVYVSDKIEWNGTYHKKCFSCSEEGCNVKLTLKAYHSFGGKLYCSKHIPVSRTSLTSDALSIKHAVNAPKKSMDAFLQAKVGGVSVEHGEVSGKIAKIVKKFDTMQAKASESSLLDKKIVELPKSIKKSPSVQNITASESSESIASENLSAKNVSQTEEISESSLSISDSADPSEIIDAAPEQQQNVDEVNSVIFDAPEDKAPEEEESGLAEDAESVSEDEAMSDNLKVFSVGDESCEAGEKLKEVLKNNEIAAAASEESL